MATLEDVRSRVKREVRSRVEKEKEVFQRQTKLITQTNVTSEYFIECGSHFQPSHYSDVIFERSVGNICGYPLCGNSIPEQRKKKQNQQWKISTVTKQILNADEACCFCSEECLLASRFYLNQLSSEPVYLRNKILKIELKSVESIREDLLGKKKKKLKKGSGEKSTNGNATVSFEEFDFQIVEKETPLQLPTEKFSQLSISDKTSSNKEGEETSATRMEEEEEEEEGTEESETPFDLFEVDLNYNPESELSPFGRIYTLLDSWCTDSTKSFLQNNVTSGTSTNDFELSRKETLSTRLSSSLHPVCQTLKLQVQELEQDLFQLIQTFSIKKPIPSFSKNDLWSIIVLVFLEIMSNRNQILKAQLEKNKLLKKKLLKHFHFGEAEFDVLVSIFN